MSNGSADFFKNLIEHWVSITTSNGQTHVGILAWYEPDHFAVKDRDGKETLFFNNAVTSIVEIPEPGKGEAKVI